MPHCAAPKITTWPGLETRTTTRPIERNASTRFMSVRFVAAHLAGDLPDRPRSRPPSCARRRDEQHGGGDDHVLAGDRPRRARSARRPTPQLRIAEIGRGLQHQVIPAQEAEQRARARSSPPASGSSAANRSGTAPPCISPDGERGVWHDPLHSVMVGLGTTMTNWGSAPSGMRGRTKKERGFRLSPSLVDCALPGVAVTVGRPYAQLPSRSESCRGCGRRGRCPDGPDRICWRGRGRAPHRRACPACWPIPVSENPSCCPADAGAAGFELSHYSVSSLLTRGTCLDPSVDCFRLRCLVNRRQGNRFPL